MTMAFNFTIIAVLGIGVIIAIGLIIALSK